jgi:hypothetical protein
MQTSAPGELFKHSIYRKKNQKIKYYNFQCVDFTHSRKNSIKNFLFKVLKNALGASVSIYLILKGDLCRSMAILIHFTFNPSIWPFKCEYLVSGKILLIYIRFWLIKIKPRDKIKSRWKLFFLFSTYLRKMEQVLVSDFYFKFIVQITFIRIYLNIDHFIFNSI